MLKLILVFLCLATGRVHALVPNGDYFVNNQGVRIWTRVAGHGPACLVITPGWGASVDLYMSSLKPLEQKYTMIYMDDRGSGRSDKPAEASRYQMSDMTSDIEAVRKFVGARRTCLIGHSMGAAIAVHYAVEHPNRLTKLILISAVPSYASETYQKHFQSNLALRQNEPWYPAFLAALQATPTTDEEFRQQMADLMPAYFHDEQSMQRSLPHFVEETFSLVGYAGFSSTNPDSSVDLTSLLPRVRTKTLVMNGVNDPWADRAQGEDLARQIRHSTFVVFENSGHFSFMEEPEKFFENF